MSRSPGPQPSGITLLSVSSFVLVWGAVAATVAGLWQPWVRVTIHQSPEGQRSFQVRDVRTFLEQTGHVTLHVRQNGRVLSTDLEALARAPRDIRGIELPHIAREERTQVALAVAAMLTGRQQDIDRYRIVVYLIPGLAGILAWCVMWGRGVAWAMMSVAGLSLGLASMAAWKLLTLPAAASVVTITIGSGLWMSVWAYVALALGAALAAASSRLSPR